MLPSASAPKPASSAEEGAPPVVLSKAEQRKLRQVAQKKERREGLAQVRLDGICRGRMAGGVEKHYPKTSFLTGSLNSIVAQVCLLAPFPFLSGSQLPGLHLAP